MYEIAEDYGVKISPAYFTALYNIEKKLQTKNITHDDILNLFFIFAISNKQIGCKKAYSFLREYLQINNIRFMLE